MNLLIITQKADADDPILGFFCGWIEEFAKRCGKVAVICLEEGRHDLSENVKVLSLGKERLTAIDSRSAKTGSRAVGVFNFYRYIWRERKDYDAVFVHMNPIYVVLGGWFWKLSDKRVALWYAHKAIDLKLRVSERFADVIFTTAEESLTLKTAKKAVVGHGIDVARYADCPRAKAIGAEPISIVSVGRITPIKNCDTLIEAARILKEKWDKRFAVAFIGSPVTKADVEYSAKIKDLVKKYGLDDIVSFAGDVKPVDMPVKYAAADITVNLTPTGGLDKAVLESMAAGVPVLSSNRAFGGYFESAAEGLGSRLIFKEGDAEGLAGKIIDLFSAGSGPRAGDLSIVRIGSALRRVAGERADASSLIAGIVKRIQALR